MKTISPSALRPHNFARAEDFDLDGLAQAVHPFDGHPDFALAVLGSPRRYVVIPRFCRHDTNRDLVFEGRSGPGDLLGCYHRRRHWCLVTGKSDSDAPDMTIYPVEIVGSHLTAWLPTDVLCGSSACTTYANYPTNPEPPIEKERD